MTAWSILSDHEFAFLQEDHYALLVKAWETKVFPTIRRRFRNEAERKSGLDQIKGALQLGQCLTFSYGGHFLIRRDVFRWHSECKSGKRVHLNVGRTSQCLLAVPLLSSVALTSLPAFSLLVIFTQCFPVYGLLKWSGLVIPGSCVSWWVIAWALKSQLCYLPDVWPWEGYLTFLNFPYL